MSLGFEAFLICQLDSQLSCSALNARHVAPPLEHPCEEAGSAVGNSAFDGEDQSPSSRISVHIPIGSNCKTQATDGSGSI